MAGSLGLDVFDVQLRRESGGWVLRVVIDRPLRRGADGAVEVDTPEDAIGIDECQQVSTDLSAILDVEDVLDHAYTLEVSSPGLDRPLRDADDYRRFTGRLAKLVVREPVDNQKAFAGRLRGVDGDDVLLEAPNGRMHRLPLRLITRGRLDVEF